MTLARKEKTLEDEIHPQCLVCCDKIRVFPNLRQSPSVAEVLSDLFRIFCKYNSWNNVRRKRNFDFTSELFPFCTACKLDLVRIYKLDEQLEDILKGINAIRLTLSAKIVETEKEKKLVLSLPSKNQRPATQSAITDTGRASVDEKKRCYENKIKYYRDTTLQRFSPMVQLTKKDNISKRRLESCLVKLGGGGNVIREDTEKAGVVLHEKSGKIDDNSNSLSCLICCEYVELYDYPSKSSSVAKILSNLFHVLCNYMQWETRRRYLLNFKFESFPFCKKCRTQLVRTYKLDENFQRIFQQVKETVRKISLKICKSEANELFRSRSRECKQGSGRLLYNAEKVRYFRSLAWKSHRSIEVNGKEPIISDTDTEGEEKSDYVPSSASEDVSASSDAESVSSGSVITSRTEGLPVSRYKKRKRILRHRKYGRRISPVGKWDFNFDDKIPFALNSKGHWLCRACNMNLGRDGRKLFRHLITHSKSLKAADPNRLSQTVPVKTTPTSKRNYKVVQVGPNKFEYGGYYYERSVNNFPIMRCVRCPYATSVFDHIAAHVVTKHVLLDRNTITQPYPNPPRTDPATDSYYVLRELDYIQMIANIYNFQCCHCPFSSKSEYMTRKHLRNRHIEPMQLPKNPPLSKSVIIKMEPGSAKGFEQSQTVGTCPYPEPAVPMNRSPVVTDVSRNTESVQNLKIYSKISSRVPLPLPTPTAPKTIEYIELD